MGIGDFLNSVGDKIEHGLETATEKVGQAYNTVLDTESRVAKAVGADGLSNFLDDLGDKIADATGGAVPEKELGETTDPKELIRGDVAKINEVTEHLGTIGTAINQTGDALRKIDIADWSGAAASAFHDEYSKQPKLWWDGADAMSRAKIALDAWSHEVSAAQIKASDAIATWEAADREERDRKNEWNAQTDEQHDGRTLTDTWTTLRDQAKAILGGARTQRDAAADTAAAAIIAATEIAPTEPPFLSRWGSNFEDLSAAMEQAKLNFTSGLLTSLTGIVQFVRSINPVDTYNITHPAEYLSTMSDLGTGMILAAADPKATASAMLSGFRTNPSEALGALTGDILTTVATGGAGGATKFGASAVDKASDAARLGNAGRNLVDDAAGAANRHPLESPGTTPVAHTPDKPVAPNTNPVNTTPDAASTKPAGTTPDAPATNPVGQAGDAPGTSSLGTDPEIPKSNQIEDSAPNPANKGPDPDVPSPESPRTPDTEPSAPHDGSPDNGPATTPNGIDDNPSGKPTPAEAEPNPATASPDGRPPQATPDTPDHPAIHPDSDNSPSATDPGGHGTHHDDGTTNAGDPDSGTQTGAHDGDAGSSPDQPDNAHERLASNDNGGNGEPSVGDTGQHNPPETDSTRDQTTEGGDPVNVATGEFLLPLTDVDLPGILRLVLKRAHHSNYRFGRWFGTSWSATLDMRVVVEADCATVVFEDGMLLPYPHAEVGVGVEPITGGQRWKLTRTDVGGYRLWDPERELVWHFAPEPVLEGLDTQLGNFAISAITDRHHNRIRFHYNSDGEPIEVTHSGGYRVILDSAEGRVTAISIVGDVDGIDIATRVREFGYENGELTTVVNDVGGTTRFAYDEQHRMLSWTDSNGSWVANTFDESGRVIAQRGLGGVMDADFEYLEFGNGGGRLTRLTDSRGGATGYGFDSDLRLRDIVNPDGGRRHIDYNRHRKPLSVTEPDGARTHYEYTSDGDVAKITRPDGTDITIEYAHVNRPTMITNPDGTTTHREWDKTGNLVAVTDAADARTQFSHNSTGAITEVRDPDGAVTRIETDPAGLPVAITDPYGSTTTIRRDPFGRPSQVTDQLGNTTHYEWTAQGKPARRVDPDGYVETWTYDGEYNLLSHTDRNGGVTRYTYGGYDKVTVRTDPDGSTTRYLYNTELHLTTVINPLGQRWIYDYDTTGRLVAGTDYTGATTTYTYTATGRVASVTPATGTTRHHRYDILGNLTSITADSGEYLAYTHDPAGRVLTAINGIDETRIHTLQFTYTPTGQVATQQLDDQPPMVNEYDHRSRRIRRTTPTGAVTTWRHNTIGQITALTADGTDIMFNHDRAGRLTGWRIGEVDVERTFTPVGGIASQEVTGFPATTSSLDFGDAPTARPDAFLIRRDDYTYRPDGYLTHHTATRSDAPSTRATYTLDPIGRVNAITRDNTLTEAYEYDALSNITASLPTATEDPQPGPSSPHRHLNGREYHNNLLVRDGRNHYYYDPAGRLIRKVTTRISRKPAVWHYRYNAFDQLTDVYTPEKEWWKYTYSPYGQRVTKSRLDQTDGQILDRKDFNYDAAQLVEQIEVDKSIRWHYIPGRYTPLTQVIDTPTAASKSALITDISGLPTTIIDLATARQQATSTHALWGITTWTGNASTPLRFPGQYADPETGLHHNYFRVYDPESGLYLAADPLGLAPADNPRTFPHNPVTWSDPLGLAPDYNQPNRNAPNFAVDSSGEASDLRPGHRPDGEQVFSGHGGIPIGDTSLTTVPPGTSVNMYGPHGDPISDALGNNIELHGTATPVETFGPGSQIPDYILSPPHGLNILGTPLTVNQSTRLSELLRANQGTVHWAACRSLY
ncbi:DUF6531 domain-containing protein [Nocardia sp. NBC_01377]|uniref:putative T7SS-secreted protein n=1 Tax=Nocardia sp. NBC_01377 TaxID=2903595 RepID=UPI00324C4A3F